MIHPSTGTLASTSCPTYGRRSCSTPLTFTSNKLSFQCQLGLLHKDHNTSPPGSTGDPYVVSTTTTIDTHWVLQHHQFWCLTSWHQVPLFAHPMVPYMVSIYLVGKTLTQRSEEAMLFAHGESLSVLQYFLFLRNSVCLAVSICLFLEWPQIQDMLSNF